MSLKIILTIIATFIIFTAFKFSYDNLIIAECGPKLEHSPNNSPSQGQLNATIAIFEINFLPANETISEYVQDYVIPSNDNLNCFPDGNEDILENNYNVSNALRNEINKSSEEEKKE
jgi:hypothetical protein